MEYFHAQYIHCGYIKLADLIINNLYYWNNIYIDCKEF